MDILFKDITVITMNPLEPVLEHAYLGVTGDKITYVDTKAPEEEARKTICGKEKVLIPGLVNAHTHIAMTALRGYADDQTLTSWLFDSIIPAESRLTDEIVYRCARLGILEAIASGTTAICDMYFSAPEIARAASELGIRAHVGNVPLETGEGFNLEDGSISETYELLRSFSEDPLITVFTGVHAVHNSNPSVWAWVNNMADTYQLPFSMHMAETAEDVESSLRKFGKTPAAALAEAGLFRYPAVAAHCVHLTDEDIAIMKEYGVTAASCPVSNLKLASGVAPLTRLKEAGVNIALGTDGVASNNNLDMFEEMKLSVLLQKNLTGNAAALSAYDALYFATVGGSVALGRGDTCGRLLPGLDADIVMLDFTAPHLHPCYNVISNVVYAAHGSDVELTMVRGRILYENRQFVRADLQKEIAEAEALAVPVIRG